MSHGAARSPKQALFQGRRARSNKPLEGSLRVRPESEAELPAEVPERPGRRWASGWRRRIRRTGSTAAAWPGRRWATSRKKMSASPSRPARSSLIPRTRRGRMAPDPFQVLRLKRKNSRRTRRTSWRSGWKNGSRRPAGPRRNRAPSWSGRGSSSDRRSG